jgi:hypothetical protein
MITTINMRADVLTRIAKAAHVRGISRSEMIVILAKRIMNDLPYPAPVGMMVQYQKRIQPPNWRKFHLRVREDEYEYLLDLRKLLKMSVSLLISRAVEKYLGDILKWNDKDNYQFKNYLIVKEVIDDVICWKLLWGYPPNIEKFIYP